MKRVLFVYNPVAGQARIQKNLYEVVEYLDDHDYAVTLCPVRKLEERWEALTADTVYDRLLCSGGDGTLNLVMSFLMRRGITIAVGYLPAGSTNDYAQSVGIDPNLQAALDQAVYGKAHAYDIGRLNEKYFLYVAGFGMFTKVSYATPQKKKNLLGHAAYLLEGIKELSELRSFSVCIETEKEKVEGDFVIGLITNSLVVGGFKDILPSDSAMDDGEFEVLLLREPTSLMELNEMAIALAQNEIEHHPNVEFIRCSRLSVTSKDPLDWTIDGEFGGSYLRAEIENLPRSFSIIR